jgi:hypothetical protein
MLDFAYPFEHVPGRGLSLSCQRRPIRDRESWGRLGIKIPQCQDLTVNFFSVLQQNFNHYNGLI